MAFRARRVITHFGATAPLHPLSQRPADRRFVREDGMISWGWSRRAEECAQGMALLPPSTVAEALGVSPQTVRRWVKAGKIGAITVEGGSDRHYITKAALDAFLASGTVVDGAA